MELLLLSFIQSVWNYFNYTTMVQLYWVIWLHVIPEHKYLSIIPMLHVGLKVIFSKAKGIYNFKKSDF